MLLMMGNTKRISTIFVAPLTVAVLFALAPTAEARNIYVDNVAGSDLLDGSVPTNTDPARGAYQSIGRAIKSARAGDHIILANSGQPYRESISLVGIQNSDTAYQPFT